MTTSKLILTDISALRPFRRRVYGLEVENYAAPGVSKTYEAAVYLANDGSNEKEVPNQSSWATSVLAEM